MLAGTLLLLANDEVKSALMYAEHSLRGRATAYGFAFSVDKIMPYLSATVGGVLLFVGAVAVGLFSFVPLGLLAYGLANVLRQGYERFISSKAP